MGMAFVKTMFNEQELASCMLNWPTVNGQARQAQKSQPLETKISEKTNYFAPFATYMLHTFYHSFPVILLSCIHIQL